MLETAQEPLSFGPFTLDRRTGELRRDGAPVAIAPQPLRLLAALASRPGELVTREELRQSIWGEETFVDFERGLNFCVLQARTALGDDAKNPVYIQTLPKRGYRFVANVTVGAPVVATAAPRRLRWQLALVAATAVVVLVAAVQQRASGRSEQARAPLTAQSTAAREAYLRGRQLWQEGKIAESIAELREATRLEPEFVLPHIALAESTHALVMGGKLDPRTAAAEIRRASEAAYRLAPRLAQTHATRAMLAFWYDWRFDDAEESYREAIRLDPGEAGALHDHGWLLIARGKLDEGIAEIRRAQELDPLSPRANTHVAWAYIYSRRYEDAEREARRALTLEPGFREAFACLHQIELLRGSKQPDSAIDAAHPYRNAARLALQGDRSAAIDWLAKAKARRDTQFVLAAADPKLISLHDDARFVELLRSVGLAPIRVR